MTFDEIRTNIANLVYDIEDTRAKDAFVRLKESHEKFRTDLVQTLCDEYNLPKEQALKIVDYFDDGKLYYAQVDEIEEFMGLHWEDVVLNHYKELIENA